MVGALVHEWIAPLGGSENVLAALSRLYPTAHLHCLWNDAPDRFLPETVNESWLSRTPLRRHKLAALPLMPLVWRYRRAPARYSWILTSSHLFAHHVQFPHCTRDTPKLSYVHSPARYLWTPEFDPRGSHPLARAAAAALKPLDASRAQESSAVAANSSFVRARIRRYWGRDAEVIHPPVDVHRIASVGDWSSLLTEQESAALAALPADFVLGASRLVPYKQLDKVIETGRLLQVPVVIAGMGPLAQQLMAAGRSAGVPVHLTGRISDALLFALYQRCRLFVFPAVEDFGIMPVEAMAAGAPVLANILGGAAETVVHGVTGGLADFDDEDSLRAGIAAALTCGASAARQRAMDFGEDIFQQRMGAWVSRHTGEAPPLLTAAAGPGAER